MSDLFGYLSKMNAGDYDYVDKLSDEEVKKLSPFVLLMWCNGAQSDPEVHTILTDMTCNEYVFPLAKHPRLLLKLFVAANGEMGHTKYKFMKSVTKEESTKITAVARYYKVGYDQAKRYLGILDEKSIEEIMNRMENYE